MKLPVHGGTARKVGKLRWGVTIVRMVSSPPATVLTANSRLIFRKRWWLYRPTAYAAPPDPPPSRCSLQSVLFSSLSCPQPKNSSSCKDSVVKYERMMNPKPAPYTLGKHALSNILMVGERRNRPTMRFQKNGLKTTVICVDWDLFVACQ